MTGFAAGLAFSAFAIFIAEMGDKTQLVAMSLATRYRALTVILGITAATAVVHAGSVLLAEVLGATLPTDWLTLAAGVAFLFFGAWTLRGDEMSDKDEARAASRRIRSAFATVFVVFLVAELGDKTMLATITLATDYGWFGTWLGSTLGMVAADALAIVIGRALGKRLPERTIAIGASVLFFIFGIWLGIEAIAELT